MVREDNTWYVAINKMDSYFSHFIGSGNEYYKNFKALAERRGLNIVAEQFDVNDTIMDKITGFDENRKRIDGDSPLTRLTKRLSKGEQLDAQEELSSLCSLS